MGSRTWIKIYSDNWIEGSMREEMPDIRGIFVDLLALAGSGKYGDDGIIKLQNNVGFTDRQFENLLKMTNFQWLKAKKRLIFTERIAVNNSNIVTIINWKKYQSEYERQKPYREENVTKSYSRKLQPKVTQEKEIEIEIEKENETVAPERQKIEFEEYVEVLRAEYADLNFDNELKKFHLYWSEGGRKLKRPKLALKNWMDKATEIKLDKEGQPSRKSKFGDGWPV